MATLYIGADIVPTQSNYHLFAEANVKQLLGKELSELLKAADFIVMNLETPLCDQKSPIIKCGPCLSAPSNTVNGIKAINPHFLTLANNHIMDQGSAGLKSTMNILKKNNILFAGAAENLGKAQKPLITQIGQKKIGIYCCAEHEFSIAGVNKPGANPYDPLESFDHVRELRKQCDFLIVLYHGGKEHYRYHSPNLQKIFHKFSDCGAGLVIAQHTHCIGCVEKYNESELVYGQGNFLFDHSDSEYWQTSLLIRIDLDGEDHNITYIPLVKKNNCVRIASGDIKRDIMNEFESRCEHILKEGFVEEEYNRFAKTMEKEYFLRFSGRRSKSPFVRVLNKLTNYKYIASQYTMSNCVVVRNVIECEAHNELATAVMNLHLADESNGK